MSFTTPLTFDSWRQSGKRFQHRGHAIFYQSAGSASAGATLLCIHGLPTASWDWHLLWPRLQTHCAHVLAPDMLGFGWSDKPNDDSYSLFDQADLHERLLREQGVQRYCILAHDYGVTVAQELLARHHEREARGDTSLVLESLCFLNGGLFPESHRPLLIQRLMLTPLGPLLSRTMSRSTFSRSFSKVFGPRTKPSAEELDQFWSLVKSGHGNRMFYRLFHYIPERRENRERWVPALLTSTLPRRLINGPADPVSGAHLATRYRELVQNPDIVSLPGIGHYPQVEDAEGVWQAMKPVLVDLTVS